MQYQAVGDQYLVAPHGLMSPEAPNPQHVIGSPVAPSERTKHVKVKNVARPNITKEPKTAANQNPTAVDVGQNQGGQAKQSTAEGATYNKIVILIISVKYLVSDWIIANA